MEKEFVPYELSLKLKELGFDSPCFGYYESQDKNLVINYSNIPLTEEQEKRKGLYLIDNRNSVLPQWAVCAPTFSQAFEWFREKYNLHISICHSVNGKFDCWTNDGNLLENGKYCDFNTYEEAELECLKKLIEIVENK